MMPSPPGEATPGSYPTDAYADAYAGAYSGL